ncbi:MAG TPA: threonine--tRNA ligase [Gammaproteobacteria bacterium]|nr:threonine--tRNA ligase [Gammaproteobacteria bacterium]HCG70198.1 threonine--tRNA ligase [Gammaproteobacteria bacterium]
MSSQVSSFEHEGEAVEHDELYKIRHSLAHVMAQAVLEMRPGSTLGFGPPIRDGFYYDFILAEPLTEEDFPDLTRRMKKIIKKGQRFDREELSAADALARIAEMGEPYKQEYGSELIDKNGLDGLTFYRNGPFLDMCEGPHVHTTKDIPRDGFKIRSVAGAYWRGNSDNVMMTRIYVWAFLDKETLDSHVEAYELALARDHKRLGRELGIYAIDNDIGKGLPLWLPNGTIVRDELENLAKELEFKAGYVRVATPHLAKESLYHTTGHLPYYAEDMYPAMELMEEADVEGEQAEGADGPRVKEAYRLRPMNCPHHHKVFDAEPRSYRDLPLRLAEYGQVYRFEDSGAVSGLVRVRGMCMNDAHIYCTAEQIKDEFKAIMGMYQEAYDILGLDTFHVRLSKWDPQDPKGKEKYVDNPEAWQESEQILEEVLVELGIDFKVGIGEGAFYGPKIDIQFNTVTGREESVSTVQLDFAVPGRMNLKYVGSDGEEHTPYCIHRAPFSTHERMVAFLIEHYGGAFPTWLAPIQVQMLTVSEQYDDYANDIVRRLRGQMVRAELAPSNDTLPKKIRQGATRKIPNLLIIGEREVADGSVTLRRYGQRDQHTMSVEAFESALMHAIKRRLPEVAVADEG